MSRAAPCIRLTFDTLINFLVGVLATIMSYVLTATAAGSKTI